MEAENKSIEQIIYDLKPEEREVLEKLKHHVEVEKGVKNRRFDDAYYLRFCLARQFDLKKVLEMFDNLLEWREAKNVDNVCKLDFPWRAEMKQYHFSTFYGLTKTKHPLYIQSYRNFNSKKMFALCSIDDTYNLAMTEYEKLVHLVLPAATKHNGFFTREIVSIVDVKPLGITSAANSKLREFGGKTLKMSQKFYPEITKKVYIINAAMTFKAIWKLCKTILDKNTVSKITLLGTNYQKTLIEEIGAENLPVEYGGTCKDPIKEPRGPWAEAWKRSEEEHRLFFDSDDEEKEEVTGDKEGEEKPSLD